MLTIHLDIYFYCTLLYRYFGDSKYLDSDSSIPHDEEEDEYEEEDEVDEEREEVDKDEEGEEGVEVDVNNVPEFHTSFTKDTPINCGKDDNIDTTGQDMDITLNIGNSANFTMIIGGEDNILSSPLPSTALTSSVQTSTATTSSIPTSTATTSSTPSSMSTSIHKISAKIKEKITPLDQVDKELERMLSEPFPFSSKKKVFLPVDCIYIYGYIWIYI